LIRAKQKNPSCYQFLSVRNFGREESLRRVTPAAVQRPPLGSTERRARRPWPVRASPQARRLVNNFAGLLAPSKTIRFPSKADHAESMVCGIAPGITRNGDHVARLQCFSRHTLTAQLAGATPFHSPSLHRPGLVGRFDM